MKIKKHILPLLKKAIALTLGSVIITSGIPFTFSQVSAADTEIAYGDADNDGSLNVFDVCKMRRQYIQKESTVSISYDLDGNEIFDTRDIKLLENYIANKIVTFPARALETGEKNLFYSEMQLDKNGELNIIRKAPEGIPMGDEGTWTIFVYLCGTDLERKDGAASEDISEMLAASTGNDARFIIETGGSEKWVNENVNPEYIQRFEICNGVMTKLSELPTAPMSDSKTLSDFLEWGVKNYPAGKMGLILWDHGGGCIDGVCQDELYDYTTLSLKDIDNALAESSCHMTDKFEFIGFDACLMAEIECANILSKYARYMYASQDVEPGKGWDYTFIGNTLRELALMDGFVLGGQTGMSYFKSCESIGSDEQATFSVIDLSKTDDLIIELNRFSKEVLEKIKNKPFLLNAMKQIRKSGDFGSSGQSNGRTNMLDLQAFINTNLFSTDNRRVYSALNAAVPYYQNGDYNWFACGLSTYYPFIIRDISDLATFAEIAVSPYYLSFIDLIAYNQGKNDAVKPYDNTKIIELWNRMQKGDTAAVEEAYQYWEKFNLAFDDYSPLIDFSFGPEITEDGYYTFELTDEAYANAAEIRAKVYMTSGDGEYRYDMGETTDVSVNGKIACDNFDGNWPSLPDSQNLAMYVRYTDQYFTEYGSPVLINGCEADLRFTRDAQGNITCDGYTYNTLGEKMFSRLYQLEKGDVIQPRFWTIELYADEEEEGFWAKGLEYVYDGTSIIDLHRLDSGWYSYGFAIYDIYGHCFVTDYADFEVTEDDILYNTF